MNNRSALPSSKRPWRYRPLVEPLEARLVFASDFGDAPLPYPTLAGEPGAQHAPVGPMLGANRDAEDDGVHSIGTDGDDNTGSPDDEDGVTFGTIRVGKVGATATANVVGGSAKLDAWIDFNRDGSWGGPLEQIADRVTLVAGDNTISFDVPSWVADGTAYGRFRLSTAGNLSVGGTAVDGEVEDYAVTVLPPKAACGCFTSHTISTAANGAWNVFAADVDSDGDADVLSASQNDGKLAWYENDGSQNFSAHTISTAADGVRSMFAADVDGDGDTDVLSTSYSYYYDKVAWYENDGSQDFIEHTISTNATAGSVFPADVDGDGDTDVLYAAVNKIAWYKNDGSQNFTSHTISTALIGARNVFAADVDADGDSDVLSASISDDKIAWYENDGSQNFSAHTISTAADGARSVFAADVDGDGDTDVLSASQNDNQIAWYENDGSQNFTAQTISTLANNPVSVFAADVDGDGDTDVLSASTLDNKIAWYKNDGSQNFAAHTISIGAVSARSVFAADVDGDGDLDVLSASALDDKIAWYENRIQKAGLQPENAPYPIIAPLPIPPPPGPISQPQRFGPATVRERPSSWLLNDRCPEMRGSFAAAFLDFASVAADTPKLAWGLDAIVRSGTKESAHVFSVVFRLLDDVFAGDVISHAAGT